MKLPFFLIFFSYLAIADYIAKELPDGMEIKTPYGTKQVIGDYGLSNYRFEIPIEEFMPEELRQLKQKGEYSENNRATNTTETKATHTIETKIIEKVESAEADSKEKDKSRVTVDYDDSDRLVLEANRLYNKRKYEETLAVVDEILRRKPDFVRGWIMKGSVLYVKGHKDLAQSAWKRAQLLKPESEDIKSIIEKYK